MMYLLDASVFSQLSEVNADDDIQHILDWLGEEFTASRVGSVAAVHNEVTARMNTRDDLLTWIDARRSAFRNIDRYSASHFALVAEAVLAHNEFSAIAAFMQGSDLYVIAQALANPKGTTVVTCEPNIPGHWKVTVPEVCASVNVNWMTPHAMFRESEVGFEFPEWPRRA